MKKKFLTTKQEVIDRLTYLYSNACLDGFAYMENLPEQVRTYKCPNCGCLVNITDKEYSDLKEIVTLVRKMGRAKVQATLNCDCYTSPWVLHHNIVYRFNIFLDKKRYVVSSSNVNDYRCLYALLSKQEAFMEDDLIVPVRERIDIIKKMTGVELNI